MLGPPLKLPRCAGAAGRAHGASSRPLRMTTDADPEVLDRRGAYSTRAALLRRLEGQGGEARRLVPGIPRLHICKGTRSR